VIDLVEMDRLVTCRRRESGRRLGPSTRSRTSWPRRPPTRPASTWWRRSPSRTRRLLEKYCAGEEIGVDELKAIRAATLNGATFVPVV
jgi:hypothetical protein